MNNQPIIKYDDDSQAKSNDSHAMIHLVGNTLRLWWLLALFIGLLAATGAAYAVFSTFQPEYKASMWLRIYSDAPFIVFQDKAGSGQFVENQTQLVRSRLVLGTLLSDPTIAKLDELADSVDKIGELAKRLIVSPVGKSEYFAVEYRGIDAKSSEQVVQLVVNSYMTLQNSDEARQRQDVMKLLGNEKTIREQKVEELRDSLAKIVESTTIVDGNKSEFTDEQFSNLAELGQRLVTLDVESAILEIEIKAFENSNALQAYAQPTKQIVLNVDSDPQVINAEAYILNLENELKSSRVGSQHPSSLKLRDEISIRKERLVELREKVSSQLGDKSQFTWQSDRTNTLQAMKSRLESYNITREVIQTHIAADTESIKKSTGDSLQVEFLRAELKQATEVHDLISHRLLALRTEQRAPARVQPLEGGGVTVIPVELMPYKKMAMFATAAFAIPFLLLFLLELWLRRVSTSRQLEGTGQLHVIGEIANLPRATIGRYVRPRHWALENQLYRESVDQLRTCLICQESNRDAQVIAIASAVSGEGKTSLATQLANSLAASTGRRVLLIDGDLRYPSAHLRHETELSPGLSDVLEKSALWKKVVRRSKPGRLYFLTAGELHASPHRLFGGSEFRKLLNQLRKHFRYIIIDTPPALSASESLVMANAADAVLFCVRRDRSRLDYVRSAHERLRQSGAESIGTVLTGVPFKKYSSKYGVYAYPESRGVSTVVNV